VWRCSSLRLASQPQASWRAVRLGIAGAHVRPWPDLGRADALPRSFAISLMIQGTTLAAYVALAAGFAPHIGIASLAAASCIVMLAASCRSVSALGTARIERRGGAPGDWPLGASALVIALLIGFLSLTVIAGTALVIMIAGDLKRIQQAITPPAAVDYVTGLDWLIRLLLPRPCCSNLHPHGWGASQRQSCRSGRAAGRRRIRLASRRQGLAGLAHFACRSLDRGRFGGPRTVHLQRLDVVWLDDWAFINKGLGWPMLLCYGATGALIVRRSQEDGLVLLLKTLAASGAAMALLDIGWAWWIAWVSISALA